jgi:hypothetical protein
MNQQTNDYKLVVVAPQKVYRADQQVPKFRINGIIHLRLLRRSPFGPVRLGADLRLSSPGKLRRRNRAFVPLMMSEMAIFHQLWAQPSESD